MTREEVIKLVGVEAVEAVDRIGNASETITVRNDDLYEFASSLILDDGTLILAYYYQEKKVFDATENLFLLPWKVDHYDIVTP